MATVDWSRKTSDVPEGARRQWRADRALRPAMSRCTHGTPGYRCDVAEPAALQVGWEEGKGVAVQGCDGAEIALIEGQEPQCAIAMREHDDREIGQPEVKAGVAIVEREDQSMFLQGQTFDAQAPGGQVFTIAPMH